MGGCGNNVSRHAGAVSGDEKIAYRGLQTGRRGDLRGKELDLRGVQQRRIVGYARHDKIELLESFHKIGHDPPRQGHGNIAGHDFRKSRFHIAVMNALPCGTPTPAKIAEPLQNGLASADKAGQPAYGHTVSMAIRNGIGQDHLGKKRKIRIVRLAVSIGVPIDAYEVLIVFQRDESGGIGAEGTDLVIVALRADKKPSES